MISYYYFIGLIFGVLVMTGTFLWAKKKNYYSGVDVAWSYSFAGLALICLLVTPELNTRKMILSFMVAVWSFRLGTHLIVRLAKHFPKEDGRYDGLKEKFKDHLYLKFYLFYLFQAVSVTYLAAPLFWNYASPLNSLTNLDMAAVILWFIAILGESLADKQLETFRVNPNNKGQVCNVGLWKYSRHPNYFFEWLIWCSYALFATSTDYGFISWYAPATILYLLLKYTGIPANEEQSLKTKGDRYREYQRTTSVFIPWFPKKNKV